MNRDHVNEQSPDEVKLELQEFEYFQPVHWRLGHVENDRYNRLSKLIAQSIANLPAVARSRKAHVLDIGCGDGAGTWQVSQLLERFGIDALSLGTDYSERAIDWARRMTSSANPARLQFVVARAEKADLELSGDRPVVVVMREVIEHLTESQFSDAIKRLRTDFASGVLLMTTPTVNSPTEAKHYRHYDVALIRHWIQSNGLEVEQIFGFGFRPKILCSSLALLKSKLNSRPFLSCLMAPLWRRVPTRWAQTLVAVASWDADGDREVLRYPRKSGTM